MSERIERVARAILEAENPDALDQYSQMACAALKATREPTDRDKFQTLLDSVVHAAYQVASSEMWTADYDRAELAAARAELEKWVFADG